MDTIDDRNAITQPISRFWHGNKVAAMDMLRLDLLHPVVSGNKWYKLRLNLKYAHEQGFKKVVTVGGGYSNHLVATAYATSKYNLKSIGVVRGNYNPPTPTLKACADYGMELIYVNQSDYADRNTPEWANRFVDDFDSTFFIPEGGANEWGRAGAGLLARFVKNNYTHVCLAVGTGTTLTGLRSKVPVNQTVIGFAPIKGGNYLTENIVSHLDADVNRNWHLVDNWHFGGFGKWNAELIGFMNDFYEQTGIPLDIVYTSKMMYGIRAMLDNNEFCSSDRILCIHTGGLQGNASVQHLLAYGH